MKTEIGIDRKNTEFAARLETEKEERQGEDTAFTVERERFSKR